MRGKIPCVLCVVLVSACGVAVRQEGDVSALLERADARAATEHYEQAAADYNPVIGEARCSTEAMEALKGLAILYLDWSIDIKAEMALE